MGYERIDEGSFLPLEVFLSGGETNLFPQAEVLNSAGNPVAGSPFDLSSVGSGLYRNLSYDPANGYYTAIYKIYTDSGHTILSTTYGKFTDQFQVSTPSGGGGSGFVGNELTFTLQANTFEFVLQSNNIEACL